MKPSTAPTAPAAEIKLRVLTIDQGRASGFKAIANPVCPKTEGPVFESMQAGMAGIDAVWLDCGQGGKGKFLLARRASELWTD